MKETYRHTKIIFTIGPATESEEMLESLIQEGVDVCRINMAHANHEWTLNTVKRIRKISEKVGRDISIMMDIKGPEIRTCPLESPIQIVAKPKGKRPSAITQLSGGEKTLTSTALLFAIYLVKPSPFCILDEVDAPLDEANVERFMQLIREFSENTQFIMVTHNRRTMELADRLYGVTMQEEGVSKLLGVKFD